MNGGWSRSLHSSPMERTVMVNILFKITALCLFTASCMNAVICQSVWMASAHLHVNRHRPLGNVWNFTEAYNTHDSLVLLLSHGSMGSWGGEREKGGEVERMGVWIPRGVIRRRMLSHVCLSGLVVEMVCVWTIQLHETQITRVDDVFFFFFFFVIMQLLMLNFLPRRSYKEIMNSCIYKREPTNY